MKKPYPKNLLRISLLIALTGVLTFIYSCKKDIHASLPEQPPTAAVLSAKAWYQRSYPKKQFLNQKISSIDSNGVDLSQLVSPDWNNAATYNRFDANVVEMPMEDGSGLMVIKNGDASGQKNQSRSWFLLLQELGKYNAYIMTIIADADYLKGDLNKLDRNKYNKRDSDFSGMVIYTTPTGKLVNGWGYKNGQVVSQMYGDSVDVGNGGNKSVQSLKNNKVSIISSTVCVDTYQITSYIDASGKKVTNPPVYLDTKCNTTYTVIDDGVNGGGGSSSGGSSSGGGSGGGTTTPNPPKPNCTVGAANAAYAKARVNNLKIQQVNPADGGGFPPPTGKVPCPTDATPSFGIDPNCLNCAVTDAKFADLIAYAQSIGLSVTEPFPTQCTVNGVTYSGMATEFYDASGRLVATYFIPDKTAGPFQAGIHYTIGNSGPTGNTSQGASSSSATIVTSSGTPVFGIPSTSVGGGSAPYTSPKGGPNSIFADFNNVNNPVNVPDEPIINNGISVIDVSSTTPVGKILAFTTNRNNTEDMTHGTTESTTNIRADDINKPDADLFAEMTNLFHTFTVFDSGMQGVGDQMITKFRNREGGTFENATLNQKVNNNANLINFLKKFGALLNDKLQVKNGDINSVTSFNLIERPVFNGFFNLFHGLEITVDDTEYTEIKLVDYNYVNGHWSATVDITIHDHFGLDRTDALNFQSRHLGFADWWLLQHRRNYLPFETIIHVRKGLIGTFN